jgi:hypothetical protein
MPPKPRWRAQREAAGQQHAIGGGASSPVASVPHEDGESGGAHALSAEHRNKLERIFVHEPNPDEEAMRMYAAVMGCPVEQVSVWFMNRRAVPGSWPSLSAAHAVAAATTTTTTTHATPESARSGLPRPETGGAVQHQLAATGAVGAVTPTTPTTPTTTATPRGPAEPSRVAQPSVIGVAHSHAPQGGWGARHTPSQRQPELEPEPEPEPEVTPPAAGGDGLLDKLWTSGTRLRARLMSESSTHGAATPRSPVSGETTAAKGAKLSFWQRYVQGISSESAGELVRLLFKRVGGGGLHRVVRCRRAAAVRHVIVGMSLAGDDSYSWMRNSAGALGRVSTSSASASSRWADVGAIEHSGEMTAALFVSTNWDRITASGSCATTSPLPLYPLHIVAPLDVLELTFFRCTLAGGRAGGWLLTGVCTALGCVAGGGAAFAELGVLKGVPLLDVSSLEEGEAIK